MPPSDLSLSVDRLRLRFAGVAGHEHRVRPIARRALELLHLRLREELGAAGAHPDGLSLDRLAVPPVDLELGVLSDEVVARKVADAMYAALCGRWQEG